MGALYLRLTGNSLEVYEYLEPLLSDFRRIKKMTKMGAFEISHIDEFIDLLLNEVRFKIFLDTARWYNFQRLPRGDLVVLIVVRVFQNYTNVRRNR